VGVCVEFQEKAAEGDRLKSVSRGEMERVWTDEWERRWEVREGIIRRGLDGFGVYGAGFAL
jgi:hypothetical protein